MKDSADSIAVTFGIRATRVAALAVLVGVFLLWSRSVQRENDAPYSTPVVLVASGLTPSATSNALPTSDAHETVHIGFVGDIMQHRRQAGDDFAACYREVAPLLRSLDFAAGNLHFPVHPDRPVGPPARSRRFNGSEENVAALADAGFDLLCTANDHAFDQELSGAVATVEVLRSHGVQPLGTGAEKADLGPIVVDIQGVRVALVAYTKRPRSYYKGEELVPWPRHWPIFELNFDDWTAEYRREGQTLFAEHVEAAADQQAEFLIALVHWGRQWHFAPSDDQRRAAHDLVDAGFDLVVGGHANVVNPAEVYHGKLIAYSLGNFISDFREMEARLGAVLEVGLGREKSQRVVLTDFRFYPVLTEREGHVVRPLRSDAAGEGQQAWRLAERVLGSDLAEFVPPAVREQRDKSESRQGGTGR